MTTLPMHRSPSRPARRSGHAPVRVAMAVASTGVVACVAWLVVGDALPGGRWFAVHTGALGTGVLLVVVTAALRPVLHGVPPAVGRVGWGLVAIAVVSLMAVVLSTRVPAEA